MQIKQVKKASADYNHENHELELSLTSYPLLLKKNIGNYGKLQLLVSQVKIGIKYTSIKHETYHLFLLYHTIIGGGMRKLGGSVSVSLPIEHEN